MTGEPLKVDDILEYRCPRFGLVWQWRVVGIYLGAEHQESLIELKPLTNRPGYASGMGPIDTSFVPEPMTRLLNVWRPHPAVSA